MEVILKAKFCFSPVRDGITLQTQNLIYDRESN